MPTLNTLRTRGAIILTIFIGLALLAFLLQDLTSASSVFRNRKNRIGSIDGNNIEYMEFSNKSDDMSRIIQMLYGRNSLSSEEMDQVREMVWETYVRQYAYDPGFRRMGLTVGEDEQKDMIKGQYLSPVITAMFTSPQTGMYDPATVEGFIANLDSDKTGQSASMWDYIKDQMVNERTFSKYMALMRNGAWVNDLEVAKGVKAANNVYSGRYVTVPFSQIPDSLVKVSQAEVRKYFAEHKKMFKQAASRDIEYVLFDLIPSEKDYAEAAAYIDNIAVEFAEAASPMQYASLNSQERTDEKYYSEEELSTDLAAIAFGTRKGEMAGPVLNGDIYTVSRVADEKMMPDSVGARHILLDRAKAASADSIARAVRGGKSIFDLAPEYSIDPTVDLGIFAPEKMVEPFADAVSAANKGEVIVVETQYGTHVVEMTYKSPMVKKVQIATITYLVEPSAATQQDAYNKAREFLTAAAGSKENFDAAVSQTGASRRVATISDRDRNVSGLNDSRELVRWSYNTKPGTVSTIFEIDGDYVVAVLTGAREAGVADIRDVSSDIARKLRDEKKAVMLTDEIKGKSFDEVAVMEGARTGNLEGLKSSAFYVPDLGVEPAVIGAVENVSAGSVSKPVKGMTGIYLVAVDSVQQIEDATSDSEKVRMEATAQTSLMQRVSQALVEESDIVDNRAKFF